MQSNPKETKKKILILGSSGMVGHLVTDYLREIKNHMVFDISRKKTPSAFTFNFDIREYEKIFDLIAENDFDYIINCVAILVKESNQNRKDAVFANAYFPQLLADFCLKKRTKIIHLSSGGVFSGSGSELYNEESVLSPPTFYGITKAAGEIANEKDLTIRNDFWGPDINEDGSGLFHWLMSQTGTIKGYDRIYFNGISTLEFCHFLDWLFVNDLTGIVHVGAKHPISKGDLLRLINDIFQLRLSIESEEKMKSAVILDSKFSTTYSKRTYVEMCEELKIYMEQKKELYKKNYQIL